MWTSQRRKLSKALDELELLARDVSALKYDLAETKERLQRLIWRTRKDSERSGEPDGTSPRSAGAAAGTPMSRGPATSTAGSAGTGSSGPWPLGTDPVSAKLLARRRRLPEAPGEAPAPTGEGDQGG